MTEPALSSRDIGRRFKGKNDEDGAGQDATDARGRSRVRSDKA